MAEKKKNIFQKIAKYFRECVGEMKKISWPTLSQTTKNFLIVLVVVIVIGALIYGLDQGLYFVLGKIMGVVPK
ncbi:MAG: preprotein translocase subunit SecE [Ruminococcaceae bacterium]|nr:preprotein translocase subunit SecE [Oscillospiraceae bacterium]